MNEYSHIETLSRKERDKLRNKEAILEAAVHMFAEKGFAETKLDEIAALAEFGKGTIYNYFENKDDLLVSSFEYALGKVSDYLEQKLADVTDPVERLRLVVNAQFEHYKNNEDFLKVVTTNQATIGKCLHGKKGKELQQRFTLLRNMLVAEIDGAISAGRLKPGSADRYASYLSGMIHGQIRQLNQKEINIEDVDSNEIMDIFLSGVSNV